MKVKGIHAAPALIIVISALIVSANYLDISKISGGVNPYLTVMALEIACIGLPAGFFCILRGTKYKDRLNLKLPKVKHAAFSLYSLLLIVSGSIALSLLLYWLMPESFAASATTGLQGSVEMTGMTDSLYAALAFGVLPAILEEFLFRGVIMAEYSPYGGGVAVVFSSLLFSFMHFAPVRLPIYIFTGIILALTACATRSVIVTAVIHAVYNVFTLYFEKYVYKIAAKQSGGMILLTFIVVTVLLISAILFFGRAEKLYRALGRENAPSPLRLKKNTGDAPPLLAALLSPTFLLMAVFFAAASFFF